MKILWITNSPFPEVFKYYNSDIPVNVGWVHSAAISLIKEVKDIQLAVASFYKVNNGLQKVTLNSVTHYLIPFNKGNYQKENRKNISYWKAIKDEFNPDITHIHGSEYPHSMDFINECGSESAVLSIQGLVSVYERYYLGGIDKKQLKKSITLRDIVRNDNVFSQQRDMFLRGKIEKQLIRKINHIIGRTSWDYAHSWAINPKVKYHFCNEILRGTFYTHKWEINKCDRFSIFISQAHYPIKGIQQLLKALPIVVNHYPKTKVFVAGHNFFSNRGVRLNGFGRYINSLIKKSNLSKYIIFTGLLSEEEMCTQFLKSHVFVCPSAIENSPNSVGEAQILGVPCISSYVGGTSDMIEHGKSGLLYRFEEFEMLAKNICDIFSSDSFANELSQNERINALKRHDKKVNSEQLYKIYSNIIGSN